jgi:hypothetical protein
LRLQRVIMPSLALFRSSADAVVDGGLFRFDNAGRRTDAARGSAGTGAAMVLAAFAFVQCADAWMTAIGIARFGPAIEANPLLALCVSTFGAGAIVAAKLIAVACGTVLHLHAHGVVLVVLTLAYIVFAILPWLCVLGA